MNTRGILERAAGIAMSGKCSVRNYQFGAIGYRSDGAMVIARNVSNSECGLANHCEYRICRKLDTGSLVYLARVTADGRWAMSRPCPGCQSRLRSKRISKVYYTIAPGEYGIMIP